ncbi:unnamed protein product [Vicia faba]|uniref:Uncharacterized protein n=1 Tax=Vicia faba TaxID=3906 RepID=A0AAV1B235_VICFA|nr:unnamed protein product [Vicia faba]
MPDQVRSSTTPQTPHACRLPLLFVYVSSSRLTFFSNHNFSHASFDSTKRKKRTSKSKGKGLRMLPIRDKSYDYSIVIETRNIEKYAQGKVDQSEGWSFVGIWIMARFSWEEGQFERIVKLRVCKVVFRWILTRGEGFVGDSPSFWLVYGLVLVHGSNMFFCGKFCKVYGQQLVAKWFGVSSMAKLEYGHEAKLWIK